MQDVFPSQAFRVNLPMRSPETLGGTITTIDGPANCGLAVSSFVPTTWLRIPTLRPAATASFSEGIIPAPSTEAMIKPLYLPDAITSWICFACSPGLNCASNSVIFMLFALAILSI
ncbi:unannotated protein [freshwater metagenome]|uniref:Unannotated protein n=1 Tax=freshwater metagenome TaxID=449393 RepID=A0A6J6BIN0_9ZZZZ